MAIRTIRYNIEVNTANGKIKIDGITQGFTKASIAAKKLQQDMIGVNKSLAQGRDATGLAGAVVVEMGRTVSDANYGLTAMANNISQLATLFTTLISKATSFKVAMGQLWTAISGPLGIVLAFQFLIQQFEAAAMKAKMVEDAFAKVRKEMEAIKRLAERTLGGSQAYIDRQIEIFNLEENLTDMRLREKDNLEGIIALRTNILQKKIRLLNVEMATYEGSYTNIEKLEKLKELNGLKRQLLRVRDEEEANLKIEKERKAHTDKMLGLKGPFKKKATLIDTLLGTTKDQLNQAAKDAKMPIKQYIEKVVDDTYESMLEYKAKDAMQGLLTDFYEDSIGLLDARYQRELTIEQNHTNLINNELRKRLLNENLSAEERKNIQLKIAQNDEALRKKQEIIEEKRFKMQKAANIAQGLIETYLAGLKALKTFGGGPWGIAAMVTTIATGLAQVAIIASQKFQTSASSAPPAGDLGIGGSGGSGNVINPNFNIVGNSAGNQIRDAIQSQFDKPLKAYVTSKDVKTAGELERNVVRSGSIG